MKPSFEFKGKRHEDRVSVIIPLYKSFDISRLQISIDSLRQQQNVNLEIVVAEQAKSPSFTPQKGVSYIFIDENKIGNPKHALPGLVRNTAARVSTGAFLYNSDGDIVYMNPNYFAEILELIKTGKNVALYRPPMRRMPLESFGEFKKTWEVEGLKNALDAVDMSEPFTARMPVSPVKMVYIRKKESGKLKTFLFSSSDYKKYVEDPRLKGSEPKYATLDVHAGATFMERAQFEAVGGFCERFAAWGCHDADLQWKLRKRFNLFEIPKFPEYEVLHLDHKRGYFDKNIWSQNRALQEQRREKGADYAIAEDLKDG